MKSQPEIQRLKTDMMKHQVLDQDEATLVFKAEQKVKVIV